jgi:oligoribonuclease NrnB/cAMP/cGMP phosphodiesterase (DHH superfamily)
MLELKDFIKKDILNKRVGIITHNDLDCSGSVIICNDLYKDVKYFTVSNQAVDKMVKLMIYAPDFADREVIFITDVSIVDKELAESIDQINKENKKKIFLFDHHGTATWLNKYDWAVVTQEEGVSASWLFFTYMEQFLNDSFDITVETRDKLEMLCRNISDWDTWLWTKNGNKTARQLAVLFSKTGINYFIQKYKSSNELLTENDYALLTDIDIKDTYINIPSIKKTAEIIDVHFKYQVDTGNGGAESVDTIKKVKCVKAADAPNDIAEQLYEDGIDYVIIFYSSGTVSVRSRVDDVNLGYWCKALAGGGGHVRSAGFTLNKDTFWVYGKYLNARYDLNNKLV